MPVALMKTCSHCRRSKRLDQFHRDARRPDGRRGYCKRCAKERDKIWYRKNRVRVKQLSKHWKQQNPERVAVNTAQSRKRYPEKERARQILSTAVYEGRVTKPSACECCGEPTIKALLHGHHTDYSKPLEVVWLCRGCHVAEHYAKQVHI